MEWHELISQAKDSILRCVIKRAPELEKDIRSIGYEIVDLPNLSELPEDSSPPLATAVKRDGFIRIEIYRRPIEVRASSNRARKSIIRFAIAEALAELLNVDIDLFTEN